jgi:hypothetical protein
MFDIFNVAGSGVNLNRVWMDAVSDIASTTSAPSCPLGCARSRFASSPMSGIPCSRRTGRRRASNR